jgi:hypothetical protein
MNEPEDFLSRWSRRKRDAATDARELSPPADATEELAPEAPETAAGESHPPIDLASLPPIDSIGAGSDIRAFLAQGVPEEMKRAALRRAWSSDPAIRDFVGLSENSWDFNAPDAIPGFGPIDGDRIRQLLAGVMGEPETDQATGRGNESPDLPAGPVATVVEQEQRPDDRCDADIEQHIVMTQDDGLATASQNELAAQPEERDSPPLRRRHGGALPE